MTQKNKYVELVREIVLGLIDKRSITVFLFGSRAGKDYFHNSDIDVGFLSHEEIDNKLFNKINESIEESLVPYHVDLIDFNNTDENFRKIALREIEIWNKAKNTNIN